MGTVIEQLERESLGIEDRKQHADKLLAALGNPSEWSHDGEVIDAGPGAAQAMNPPTCACGHPICYLFIIHRGQEQKQVGSTCIDVIAGISPGLGEALQKRAEQLRAEIAERERKVRDDARYEELQGLMAETDQLLLSVNTAGLALIATTSSGSYGRNLVHHRMHPAPWWAYNVATTSWAPMANDTTKVHYLREGLPRKKYSRVLSYLKLTREINETLREVLGKLTA